ncbi:interferon-induced 35 kDa protein [Pelodiscus sinensis]|uniref:interferon-induced 35 kDa protein n=1 Tax=Pelodiscus sinensis TaxID=13735 RepID=UPI003F6B4E81
MVAPGAGLRSGRVCGTAAGGAGGGGRGREAKVKGGESEPGSAAAAGVSDTMTDSEEESFVRLPDALKLEDSSLAMSPERLQQEIEKFKEQRHVLEQDRLELRAAKEAAERKTRGFQKEAKVLREKLERETSRSWELEPPFQELCLAKEERSKLLEQKQELEKQLAELEERRVALEEQAKAPLALPDRTMVFKGHVAEAEDVTALVVTPRIQRVLPGGCALITFERPDVAQRILDMKWHEVKLDESAGSEGRVRMQARPVELLLPSALEIELELSDRSILLSNLPRLDLTEELLLDKLELFFSKRKHGGGEVERRELLHDSGNVVLTFVHDGVAEQLVKKGRTQVPIGKQTFELKVTPYTSGEIRDLQLHPSVCARTVLLSGIPDVLDEESMRDALEIHFQKPSRGGGEVDALGYVPAGKQALAVFEEDTD